jgi:hypothetical protein
MTLSNYPYDFDNNQNLYVVHDYLRLKLAEDYSPGDTSITVYENTSVMAKFPGSAEGGGIITLTDQCSNPEERAISFTYTSKTATTFNGIKIVPGFKDVAKYKDLTNVTQNVVAQHHNTLKDSIIAIEKFAGLQGTKAEMPLTGTIEERINYLRSIVLVPKAWFSVDKRLGVLIPTSACEGSGKGLTVNFTDLSFRLGTDGSSEKLKHTWYFNLKPIINDYGVPINKAAGDEEITLNNIDFYYNEKETLSYETIINDLTVTDNQVKQYTYCYPGIYTVALKVENDFGEDTVIFNELINVKEVCPDEAEMQFTTRLMQFIFNSNLRTPVNVPVEITVRNSGAKINDEITNYTWSIADDLNHFNSNITRAVFSVGGFYDVILRVDTKLKNYRITTLENQIDVVEKLNMWLWTVSNDSTSITSHEFGLISETFKTLTTKSISKIDDSFIRSSTCIDGPDYYRTEKCRKTREFQRNNGFSKANSILSGDGSKGIIYWASGRKSSEPTSKEKINLENYSGFTDCYSSASQIDRQWNWVGLSSKTSLYFFLGLTDPRSNQTNVSVQKISLNNASLSESSAAVSVYADLTYSNGAEELKNNSIFDLWDNGVATTTTNPAIKEYYSCYRSVWKDGAGYILRNQDQGTFFRFRGFYKTSGTSSNEVTGIKKINDLSGPTKAEGELLNMANGIFLFNNSGSVGVFNSSTNVWVTGGPGTNSNQFRSMQDVNVSNFDDQRQTLLASSDEDHNAYISYDYSENSFIKFNDIDLTFKYIGNRPSGKQWLSTIY